MVQVAHPLDVRSQLDTALVQQTRAFFGNNPAPSDQSQVLPPAYPAASSASNPANVPAYTAQPRPTERVISRTDSTLASPGSRVDPRPLPDTFSYESPRLVLDLGRRIWPSRWPVYGVNDVVTGKVVVKKVDHAINICVTLEGLCVTTLIERGMPIAQFQIALTQQTIKLWSNDTGDPPRSSYDFSFPLPTYSQGSTEPLPPSGYHSVLMRGYVEIKYYVKVDMTRSRFHRHETAMATIHYLPRSYPPPTDLLGHELDVVSAVDDDIWQTVELSPVAARPGRKGAPPTDTSKHISVQFSLLKRQVYTACTPIPFRLNIQSSSPALALLPHATVHLVKRWILVASSFNVRVARDIILGSGEVWRVEETDEGAGCSKVVSGCVVGGKQEAEVSWKVDGAFKIEYLVRVCIKPPEDMRFLGASLPTFFHQEVVRMTTHEYTSDELVRGHPALRLAQQCVW